MKRLIFYFSMALVPLLGIGQRPGLEWAEQFSTGSTESAFRILRDYQDNFLTLTAFQGTTIVGGQTYTAMAEPLQWDFVLSKYDSQRNHLWTKQIYTNDISQIGGGMNFPEAEIDGSGNVYLFSVFDGMMNIGGTTVSSGTSTQIGQRVAAMVSKIDGAGTVQWAINAGEYTNGGGGGDMFVSSNGDVVIESVVFDDLIVNGNTIIASPNGSTFFEGINTNGAVSWTTVMTGSHYWMPNDWGKDVPNGALNGYVCGGFDGTLTIAPSNGLSMTSSGGNDAYLAQVQAHSFAFMLWARTVTGPPTGEEAFLKLVTTSSGIYALGRSSGGLLDFGNGVTLNLTGSRYFLTKYTSSGNVVYASDVAGYGNAQPTDLRSDALGNLYLSGGFADSLVFTNGTVLHSNGGYDGFIAKMDPQTGNVHWAFSFGGSGSDRTQQIVANADNEVYAAVVFNNVLQLDGNTFTSNGDADALYLKFSGCLVPPITLVSSNGTTLCNGQSTVLSVDSLPGGSYSWYLNGAVIPGETGISLSAGQSGNYAAVVSLGGACVDTSNAVSLTFSSVSFDVLTTPPNVSGLCENSSLQLSTSLPFVNYLWSNGTTNGNATIYVPGTYVVTVTDFFGCTGVDSITVVGYAAPSVPDIDVAVNCVLACDTSLAVGSYKWRLNGNIVGGNTQFLDANLYGNGFYSVEITDLHGCKSMSPLTNVSCATVGVPEPEGMVLEVFPNPSSGVVWIKAGNALRGPVDVAVVDVLGVVRQSLRVRPVNGVVEQALDLGGLAAGYYVVRVFNRERWTQRGVILKE